MRTEVIEACTIDEAVERILNELKTDTRKSSNRENVIYFDGWDGLGASPVLQAVAKYLTVWSEMSTRPVGLEFEEIIYIDCSIWESRRALQRKIAEQLKLPGWVMEMFDKQDEEDDFYGLDQGSRGEIAQIFTEIYQTIQNRRFLLILHNGGNEEIDIFNFGLPLYGYANSKMLWTFRGRFRLDPKVIDNVKKSTTTHVLLSASNDRRDPQQLWSYLVCHEAAQVSCNKQGHGIIDSAIVTKCVLYLLKQCCIGSHIVEYDWDIHTSNYWVCNGVIPLADIDKAWKVGDVLQRELRLLNSDNRLTNDKSTMVLSSHLARSVEHMPYCISTETCGFVQSLSSVILENMFQHSHTLNMLKISWCTFNFSSPPFLCCHNLRFLWVEHCQDHLTRRTTYHDHTDTDKEKEEAENRTTVSWACFQSLLVLDLRYTDCDQFLSPRVMDLMTQLRVLNVMGVKNWDMSHLRGCLLNIRKLRVTKSMCYFNNDVFSGMERLELLDFSRNRIIKGTTSLFGPARNNSLKTVIIDGCSGLKIISFRDCKELNKLSLKTPLWFIKELDISGTKVKTLDLGEFSAGYLPRRIILVGCEKLCRISWPKHVSSLDLHRVQLRIDTTSTSASADRVEAPQAAHPHGDRSLQQQKEENFNRWHISLMDARLLRSLSPVRDYLRQRGMHIDICAAAILGGSNVQGTSSNKQVQFCEYRDVLKDGPVEVMMMWECPEVKWSYRTCIIKVIMHEQAKELLENALGASTSALSVPDFICNDAISLHVYDNPSITSIPAPPKGSQWKELRWCRVERCPNILTVFPRPQSDEANNFNCLQTFWASQLLSTRCIWDKPYFFEYLKLLHLDHCPRLVHVLPLFKVNPSFKGHPIRPLHALETLEIVYCGDLKEVFPLDPKLDELDEVIELPSLKGIHLHELPMLQHICRLRMRARNLETVKIRGCWSLRRLPAVGHNTKPPKVDCEKECGTTWSGTGLRRTITHPSTIRATRCTTRPSCPESAYSGNQLLP
uniref:Uncharacterized protein n=2 Tax=Avena sativa TaxID=4498 RepID=A0ACD5Z9H8_AVESA